jgi:hypothetical protein
MEKLSILDPLFHYQEWMLLRENVAGYWLLGRIYAGMALPIWMMGFNP